LYYLRIALFYFGAAAHQFKIRDRFRTSLERSAQRTADATYLVSRLGNDVLCTDRVAGSFPTRALTHEVSLRVPLEIGAGSLTVPVFSPEKEGDVSIESNPRKVERSLCGVWFYLLTPSSCWILFRNLNQKEAFP